MTERWGKTDFHDPWDYADANPMAPRGMPAVGQSSQVQELLKVLELLGAVGPNAMNSAESLVRGQPQQPFNPTLSHSENLVDKGMPWGAAGVLGTLLDFIEPGPGEFGKAAPAIIGMAAAAPKGVREAIARVMKGSKDSVPQTHIGNIIDEAVLAATPWQRIQHYTSFSQAELEDYARTEGVQAAMDLLSDYGFTPEDLNSVRKSLEYLDRTIDVGR